MRTIRQVTDFDEKVAALLTRHADLLIAPTPPRGLWVCEEDGEPIIALTVYTEPRIRVGLVVDRPETRPFASIASLVEAFEEWGKTVGLKAYTVVADRADDRFCALVERRGGVVLASEKDWVEYLIRLNQPADLSDGIRPWQPTDWRGLRPLVKAFLTEHYAAGGDFRPTRQNTEAFLRRGVQGAAAGDPCVVAIEGGKIVGFTLWVGLPDFGLETRERVCSGLGTYVVKECRRQGWSRRIREAAIELAKTAGYTRLDGTALDRRGLKAAESTGATVVGVQVRLPLAAAERKVA